MTLFSYVHIFSAVISYLSVFLLFSKRVGSKQHKKIGTVYTCSMLIAAFSGFFIHNAAKLFGNFSIFHVFSVITFITIIRGWVSLRTYRTSREPKHLRRHYLNMAYSFMGLNLAAISQMTGAFPFTVSLSQLLGVYIVVIGISVFLVQRVFYQRFSKYLSEKPA